MDANELIWQTFEFIHGKNMKRTIYADQPCVITGRKEGWIEIMPAHPKTDIGGGEGLRIFVLQSDLQSP